MQRIQRWTFAALVAGIAVALAGYSASDRLWWKPPHFDGFTRPAGPLPILTQADYDRVQSSHARPYIVHLATDRGAVMCYGATHSRDPLDPQMADIQTRWRRFRPTAALLEGRLGLAFGDLDAGIRRFGESGLIYRMAKEAGIPVYTWEPPLQDEVAALLKNSTPKRVATYYVLRPYFSDLRHGKPADPEATVLPTLKRRTKLPGLEGTLASVADLDAFWKQEFPNGKDWRDTSDEYGLPGFLGALSARSNAFRDEYFARVIVELVHRGERVFAVAGSSHAVKLEPALKHAFETSDL